MKFCIQFKFSIIICKNDVCSSNILIFNSSKYASALTFETLIMTFSEAHTVTAFYYIFLCTIMMKANHFLFNLMPIRIFFQGATSFSERTLKMEVATDFHTNRIVVSAERYFAVFCHISF